ncbi:MAG: choice-of-anchor B family protein [Gemmatimonadetes bacterium]|nr:choice-of-anchor B family protein [Gemmatimonadota bacterium]MYH52460.1 choice-of-anchor B family protein [Gemmatimonadota bacterium]MYK65171.1 choice-of-anchor B family protein [Gemmatimonadota bacterium]
MKRAERQGRTSPQAAVHGICTLAAAWGVGILLLTPPGTAQQPVHAIPCEDGSADGYPCDRVDLLSRLSPRELGAADSILLNDVWGWTDPRTGGEYALVGRMDGVAFVDVTEPHLPRYLGSLAATDGSRITIWRDVKVFRDHAFIVAGGAGRHGMQVFDLRQLREVAEPRDFTPSAVYNGVEASINVAINAETGFAFLLTSTGGETCGGGAHIVDIGDPLDPVFAGCFAHPGTGRRLTGTTHDAQCVVYHGPDETYQGREICLSANETAISVADLTDKRNPNPIATAQYPGLGYAHQGWLTEDHRHFYSTDEMDEMTGTAERQRTLIWDVSDLDDPLLVKEYFAPVGGPEHNLHVRGDRLYVTDKRAGLRVLDIGDPENPVEAGYFDTTSPGADRTRFVGAWSVYPFFESGSVLVSSRTGGLFVVRPR